MQKIDPLPRTIPGKQGNSTVQDSSEPPQSEKIQNAVLNVMVTMAFKQIETTQL